MENDEKVNENSQENTGSDSTTRARNRTVMLTPDITNEVRARLKGEHSGEESEVGTSADFQLPDGAGSNYMPKSLGGQGASDFERPVANSTPEPVHNVSHAAKNVAAKSYGEGVVWEKESPVAGFLVSFDNNENGITFELRTGRLIVTSEVLGSGNYLLINDDTVSPMHAIMRIGKDGTIHLLDQLSEFGTKIKHGDSEEELSGDKGIVRHGDVVTFGMRSFHVCLLSLDSED